MFFLLKCGVWLAIVYAAILYGIGPLGRFSNDETRRQVAGDAARAGRNAVGGIVSGMVGGEAPGPCVGRRAECLADAARLTALLESSLRTDPAETPKVLRQIVPPAVPLPVRDPRRHAGPLRLPSKS